MPPPCGSTQLCSSGALVHNLCTCCCCSNVMDIIDYLNIYLSVYLFMFICLCMLVVLYYLAITAITAELLVI